MMCDNTYNFAPPWNNSFYYHYLQQHAILSHQFQKMHSDIHHYGDQYNMYNPADVYDQGDYSSSCSCSSCSSCCSSESCSKTSSEYEEQEVMDSEEGYEEEQYEDEDYDEDESDCEYEFNADVILAMRAAKEELKKQEQAETENDESSESKDEESSDSKNESDSVVLIDSDKDDFEFIDPSSTSILDTLYKDVGKFNKTHEKENKKAVAEFMYGSEGMKVLHLESALSSRYEQLCDCLQPSLWPVLPLRL